MFIASTVGAQLDESYVSTFLNGNELDGENVDSQYSKLDFSKLWTNTVNYQVKGIIGDNHQRIKIAFTLIEQSTDDVLLYHVSGKSKVKNNICDFYGSIKIDSIREVSNSQFGVDNEKVNSVAIRGVLFASYHFYETKNQQHSGVFAGKLMTRWYINKIGELSYDDLDSIADGYVNNAFVGSWSLHGSDDKRICNMETIGYPIVRRTLM